MSEGMRVAAARGDAQTPPCPTRHIPLSPRIFPASYSAETSEEQEKKCSFRNERRPTLRFGVNGSGGDPWDGSRQGRNACGVSSPQPPAFAVTPDTVCPCSDGCEHSFYS